MIRLILFAFLLAVPIAEIAVFLLVGREIGALPTIALIILTAILGAILLKKQGLSAFARLQDDIRAHRVPAAAIGHALTVAIAGALLLTPGFITDSVGFLLFIPAVRAGLWRLIAGSVKVHAAEGPHDRPRPMPGSPHGSSRPGTIDLEAGEYGPADPASPWSAGGQGR